MSLADSFLDDLDDLDSNGEEDNEEEVEDDDDDEDDNLDNMLDTMQSAGDISSVASLRTSEAFLNHMDKINESLSKPPAPIYGNVEDNPEYQLIVSCNDLVNQIDEEVLTVYKYVVDIYSKKFPELESSQWSLRISQNSETDRQ
jgi:U4/U6 small nuclear ribonucleoprotein PRP31